MKTWAAVEKNLYEKDANKHAGGKARTDLDKIFSDCGFSSLEINAPLQEREKAGKIKKIIYHFEVCKQWKNAIDQLNPSDALILQFPLKNHTLFFSKVIRYAHKKKIKVTAFIHDLEVLRFSKIKGLPLLTKWRIKLEELDEMELFDQVVVHNDLMKTYLHIHWHISNEKMYSLGIFDYLTDKTSDSWNISEQHNRCIIAGNLNREKSGYIYELPEKPDFELYGINYEEQSGKNLHYHGSYTSDELPAHLTGDFGVVWDGDSAQTCSGVWGEYLRYNNPHKASLYLACGIPIIIWSEAAMARYVEEHKVGILVHSLFEIDEKTKALSTDEYRILKQNAQELSKEIRQGYNTKEVLRKMGFLNEYWQKLIDQTICFDE